MHHFTSQNHFFLFLLTFTFSPLVTTARIPNHHTKKSSQLDSLPDLSIQIPGLQYLSRYVCPYSPPPNKRQAEDALSISKEQLIAFLNQLRVIQDATVDSIEETLLGDGYTREEVDKALGGVVGGCLGGLAASTSVEVSAQTAGSEYAVVATSTTDFVVAVSTASLYRGEGQEAVFTPVLTRNIVDAVSTMSSISEKEQEPVFTPIPTVSTSNIVDAVSTISSALEEQEPIFTQNPTLSQRNDAASTATKTVLTTETTTHQPQTSIVNPSDPNLGRSYIFNTQSTSNIAVYYGQSPATTSKTLAQQCADPSIDIVILAFITTNTGPSSYPTINFGAACPQAQTPSMAAKAPGLKSCPALARDILTCQVVFGKKVLVSMGGAAGSGVSFQNDDQAKAFGDVLWGVFGKSGQVGVDQGLRPFGSVVIDGFDFDNENGNPTSYTLLATTLRNHMNTDTSKTYYLSSAPQCPIPDASNPLSMLLLCDFLFVQFYNNPSCEIGSSGFLSSVEMWSLKLKNGRSKGRIFVGAPAWSVAGPTAYDSGIGSASGIEEVAKKVRSTGVELGGMMFWAGPEGMENTEDGKSILDWAKVGLTS